jgi:ribosomal protein S18 acetylase RimI-like enzyme
MRLPWYTHLYHHLRGPNPLHPTVWKGRIPAITFRRYRESDLNGCVNLYDLNAPARFPKLEPPYSTTLTSERSYTLVAEKNGELIAAGSVSYHRAPGFLNRKAAVLSFGLVHPDYQNKGIGTALVLARLALLKPSEEYYFVLIFAVNQSIGFYRRLGFQDVAKWKDCDGQEHPVAMLEFLRREIRACRKLLADQQVIYPDNEELVPLVQFERSPAAT